MRVSIRAMVFRGALALGFALVGCGGSDTSGAGDAGSKDQFISQLCAELSPCCEAAGRPSDGVQCRAFYGAFVPAMGYDQAAASACLDEVRALNSAQKCDASSTNAASCRKVFVASGTAQPGESCEDDSDCAPAETGQVGCESNFVDNATVQQCQVRLPGKAGSTPCVGTVDGNITSYSGNLDGIPTTGYLCDLADGLSCDGQTGACEALAQPGEPCAGGFYSCVQSAYCAFGEGVCRDRLAAGEACQGDEECQATAYCEPSGKTCVARAGHDEPCSTNAECASDNCTNQKCGPKNDLSLIFIFGTD